MAKNVADVAAAARRNGNHGARAQTEGSVKTKIGLKFERYFTPPGSHAYDLVEWERRTAAITSEKGQIIFEQKDVEVPRSWSQLAINVVAQKYFRGAPGSPERETSVRQIIDRVVDTLARWGREGGYFATDEDADNWAEELRFLLVTQHASFNSPVWFHIGVPGRSQQGSARLLNSADDSVQFQNANHSVRLSDEFMNAVAEDKDWETHAIVDGRVVDTYKARKVWRDIADAAWICGDPGLQFDSTIQDWNVVPNTGRINATNPCSEFVFLDDTACNLLSLNLMKFQVEGGVFDVERFRRAVDVCFTGQEILVSNASYPTPAIGKNSEALRPLGLGYAN